jgi:hypothetical protein
LDRVLFCSAMAAPSREQGLIWVEESGTTVYLFDRMARRRLAVGGGWPLSRM